MKNKTKGIVLPSPILDLAFTLMIILFLCLTLKAEAEKAMEHQTPIILTEGHASARPSGMGTDSPTLSIQKQGPDTYHFVLKSRKLGLKPFSSLENLFTELKRLQPAEVILRVDQAAAFAIPHKVIIFAYNHQINISISYKQEG